MAKLVIEYEIADVPQEELVEALGVAFGYIKTVRKYDNSKVEIVDNPQGIEEFVKEKLSDYVHQNYIRGGERIAARKASKEFRDKHKAKKA